MKNYQIEQLKNKRHGYTPLPNSIFDLLYGKFALNDREFICFLVVYMNFTQFNPTSPYFGTFKASNKDISYLLGWTESKISRAMEGLRTKGLLIENDSGLYELMGYRVVSLLTDHYGKARNKQQPQRRYIQVTDAIEYCIKNGNNFANAKTLADLQELELAIYLENIDFKENLLDELPP